MFTVKREITVPTGKIFTGRDERSNPVECLWIQDYGQQSNLKADFLGLCDSIQEVEHKEMLSKHEKIVVTVSSQSGCSMGCGFCDVPKVGKGKNLSLQNIKAQVDMLLVDAMGDNIYGERLNIHYARMGEPTFNRHILAHARTLKSQYESNFTTVHPVISTMMPKKNKELLPYLTEWLDIKNKTYSGEAGLQLSINSTSNHERDVMFNGSCRTIEEVGEIAKELVSRCGVVGRKITLNFALGGYEIDELLLLKYFNPEHFLCKLTPMHITESVVNNKVPFIQPYEEIEDRLKKVGYDVIVFIPSKEEDLGRITCGNALLSGSMPEIRYEQVIFKSTLEN